MKPFASAKLTADGVPMDFETAGCDVLEGDSVIISTPSGEFYATVVPDTPHNCVTSCRCETKLVRRATEGDRNINERKLNREGNAYRSCLMKIKERGIPMKLVRVEYEIKGNRTTFFFTAEHRVDFRALVRALAREFQTRIEMRQIGPRNASGMLGGYGTCGRSLCCAKWLNQFRPISIKMAKKQNLSLNPSKLTGQCGRLKCCLAYEHE